MPAALDFVDWPKDRTLAVAGSAGGLRVPLTLKNASTQPAQLAQVSVAEVRLDGKGPPLRVEPVPIQLSVAGQGVAQTEVKLKLDDRTPPGRYEGLLKIGDLTRQVVIEVLPEPKLQIRPAGV